MATSRLRTVLLFLVLALVLTTTACRSAPRFPPAQIARSLAASDREPAAQPIEFWEPPLDGPLRVTRPFQPPPSRYAAGHRGVDLAGSARQHVLAAGSGTVTWAGVLAGRGVVVVSHGALRTTYEPVAVLVKTGAVVRAGDVIAALQPGHPGCPVAACLHWGLLRGSDYLDPMTLIDRVVRLLPLGDGR